MKTVSKKSANAKTSRSKLSTGRKPRTSHGKAIESTDLNVDDTRTNSDVNDEENYTDDKRDQKDSNTVADSSSIQDTSVEEEQDREALRKMEGNHPDEALN